MQDNTIRPLAYAIAGILDGLNKWATAELRQRAHPRHMPTEDIGDYAHRILSEQPTAEAAKFALRQDQIDYLEGSLRVFQRVYDQVREIKKAIDGLEEACKHNIAASQVNLGHGGLTGTEGLAIENARRYEVARTAINELKTQLVSTLEQGIYGREAAGSSAYDRLLAAEISPSRVLERIHTTRKELARTTSTRGKLYEIALNRQELTALCTYIEMEYSSGLSSGEHTSLENLNARNFLLGLIATEKMMADPSLFDKTKPADKQP